MLAKRTLDEGEAEAWLAQFNDAATALTSREARLAEAAEAVEEQLSLIGISAVEDLLQEGVPEAVSQLQAAKINVWVHLLTMVASALTSFLIYSLAYLLTAAGGQHQDMDAHG